MHTGTATDARVSLSEGTHTTIPYQKQLDEEVIVLPLP